MIILFSIVKVGPSDFGRYLNTETILALSKISEFGPGLSIIITGQVYIVVAGLLFFLDMAMDLVLGFFPFYSKLFRPLIQQGKILESLYKEGYQNNLELPVYSVLFPIFKWLF